MQSHLLSLYDYKIKVVFLSTTSLKATRTQATLEQGEIMYECEGKRMDACCALGYNVWQGSTRRMRHLALHVSIQVISIQVMQRCIESKRILPSI